MSWIYWKEWKVILACIEEHRFQIGWAMKQNGVGRPPIVGCHLLLGASMECTKGISARGDVVRDESCSAIASDGSDVRVQWGQRHGQNDLK